MLDEIIPQINILQLMTTISPAEFKQTTHTKFGKHVVCEDEDLKLWFMLYAVKKWIKFMIMKVYLDQF